MCTVCGCDEGANVSIDGKIAHHHHHGHAHDHHHHDHDHAHDHDDHHHHHHDHDHHHDAAPVARGDDVHWGEGPARAHAPGLTQARMIAIETDILSKNDGYAAQNRARFEAAGTLALNLVSSPGSGKTTLLCATIRALAGAFPVCVVEGDQQTSNDAERIRATGVRAVQVNTGKGCHLDAHMVGHALDHLALDHLAPQPYGIVFIENVGNLVCPAAFDLGEAAKVAILSVTEGEDKPLKYPDMFAASRLVVLNKTDLAPHCDVDLDLIEENVRRVSPLAEVIRLSARTGEGLDAFTGWITRERRAVLDRAADEAQARADAIRRAAAAE